LDEVNTLADELGSSVIDPYDISFILYGLLGKYVVLECIGCPIFLGLLMLNVIGIMIEN
jgi:hypothetical protein